MSLNSSVQQLAAGFAAWFSGIILGQSATGQITHFSVTGFVSVAFALFCIYLSRFLVTQDQRRNIESMAMVEAAGQSDGTG